MTALQEDPFKLVVLSRDPETASQSNANFFFGDDGDLAFFATDDNGVLRIYDYNPLGVSRVSQTHATG